MTSIEWLEEQLTYQHSGETLNKFYDWKDITNIYNQAKLLHKQEIADAYEEGYNRAVKVIEDETQRILKDSI